MQVALKYLSRVLQIDTRLPSSDYSLASTYTNICAILSNMNKHKEAYKVAKRANNLFTKIRENMGENTDGDKNNLSVNYVLSFLNLAICSESVGHRQEAIEVANQGRQFASLDLGDTHQLSMKLDTLITSLNHKSTVSSTRHGYTVNRMMMRPSTNTSTNHSMADGSTVLSLPRISSTLPNRSISLDDTGQYKLKILNARRDEISIIDDSVQCRQRGYRHRYTGREGGSIGRGENRYPFKYMPKGRNRGDRDNSKDRDRDNRDIGESRDGNRMPMLPKLRIIGGKKGEEKVKKGKIEKGKGVMVRKVKEDKVEREVELDSHGTMNIALNREEKIDNNEQSQQYPPLSSMENSEHKDNQALEISLTQSNKRLHPEEDMLIDPQIFLSN